MTDTDDHRYMAQALRLAARGLYSTAPNPRVGCVIVRDGEVVGEGWHEYAGGPHAEVDALAQAGARARGATVYLTLEPCCHHGRTPPCTDALLRAGVARVVCAMQDPNPRVAGQGLAQLAQAGIATACGPMQAQAEALNPGFIRRMRDGRPYVRCKLAMSLDGRTALASGESQWITGVDARRDVQRLRARSSAILTGIGTVLADDPALTVRREDWDAEDAARIARWPQPLRVVLDSALRLPPSARLLREPGATLVVTANEDAEAQARLADAGAQLACLPSADGRVDLNAALRLLAEREVNELHVEAGPTLSGALLQAGLIDELVIYVAPRLLGDAARGLFHLPGLERMAQVIDLQIIDQRAVGRDWRITARVRQKT